MYLLFTLVYGLGIPISVTAFVGGLHSLAYMNRSGLFLICYAVIPLTILLVISPFQNVAGYYLFFTMPAYLLLAAFCTSELMEAAFRKSKILSVAVMLVILVALLSQTYMYFAKENGGRPKWREAFQTIRNRAGTDDIVVVSMPRIAEYYLQKQGGGAQSAGTVSSVPKVMQLKDVMQQLGTLETQWRTTGQSVWLVLDQPCLSVRDANGKFREWVYSNCQLIKKFPVYARFMDRTINIWNVKYITLDIDPGLPNEFDEGLFF
jgi:hypothetical protein